MDLKGKNRLYRLLEVKDVLVEWSNLASGKARNLIFLNPIFLGIGNHFWDHFQNPHIDLKGKNILNRLL